MAGEGARKGITIARVERQYIRTRARIIRHECRRGTKRKLGSSTQRWTCFLMGSSARINILGGLETTTRTRVRAVGTDVSIWLTSLSLSLFCCLSSYLALSRFILFYLDSPSNHLFLPQDRSRSRTQRSRLSKNSRELRHYLVVGSRLLYLLSNLISTAMAVYFHSNQPTLYVHSSRLEKICNGTVHFPLPLSRVRKFTLDWLIVRFSSTGNSRRPKS